jgi:CRISPR/Cas system-associated exonuclease Cas4 (RecB family)
MTLSDLRGLPHLSVSQLKTFLQCPRKYRFQYVDRLEPAFRPIALAFGTAWHHAVGHHLSASTHERPVPVEELRAVFRDSLDVEVLQDGPPVLFDDDEDLGQCVDLGMRMLDVFLSKVPLPKRVLGVEIPFVLEIVHPVTGEAASLPVIGALDAVVVEDDGPSVWELKTGKKKWSADQLEFDLQPTAYTMAARELGHDEVAVKLLVTTKTTKPDVQLERLVRRHGDIQELAETAIGVLQAVQTGLDLRLRGWACRSCGYAAVCSP